MFEHFAQWGVFNVTHEFVYAKMYLSVCMQWAWHLPQAVN